MQKFEEENKTQQNKPNPNHHENESRNYEIETKKTIQRINKYKIWFFDNISKIDRPLTQLTKKEERAQMNRIRNEQESIKADTKEIWGIKGECFYTLYSIKLKNLKEIDKFLD